MSAVVSSRLTRRVRRESRALVREVARALRRFGDRLPQRVRDELQLGADNLARAARDRDGSRMRHELAPLDTLAVEHLAIAKKSTFREYIDSIAVAVVIALLLRAFVIAAFKIPSGSMIPTLEIGDHIFVNKLLYGVHLPFSEDRAITWHSPKRGEVIVFARPCMLEKDFIKRVVAVGNDTVEVRCDKVYVNGSAVPSRLAAESSLYWNHRPEGDEWGASCDVNSYQQTWGRCSAADYIEAPGGFQATDGHEHHTYHALDRPLLDAARKRGEAGGTYWSYYPGRGAGTDRRLHYRANDFPKLPEPTGIDSLSPDTDFGPVVVESSGPEKMKAIRRMLQGVRPEIIAKELSIRFAEEPWCEGPNCVSADDVLNWLPEPLSCDEPEMDWDAAARWQNRSSWVAADVTSSQGPCDPQLSYVVPDDHVFVMGDNRDNSSDSRYWGTVPLDNVRGKALFIWYSGKPAEAGGIRWGRMGKLLR